LRYYRTIRLDERNGIAKRTPEYIQKKKCKDAVIALDNGNLAGFCYIESWQESNYVAHSGLIVHPDYRNLGLKKNQKF
jgi:N-acetylglutamate synthase-like GNAT family acetyltransferase